MKKNIKNILIVDDDIETSVKTRNGWKKKMML
jgi:hypothetical protein